MTTARTSMLEGIRSNLARSAAFEHLYHHLQPSLRAAAPIVPELSRKGLADRFSVELEAVGGEVHRVQGDKEVFAAMGAVLQAVGAKRVAVSDSGLLKGINFEGIDQIVDPSREELFAMDAGITTAQLAIAETGTLVLRSSMERHRLVSLVPPIHICVLRADVVMPTMSSVLEKMSGAIDPAITFVTGPSRTSDIELTLAIGVHGPKQLIVVLID